MSATRSPGRGSGSACALRPPAALRPAGRSLNRTECGTLGFTPHLLPSPTHSQTSGLSPTSTERGLCSVLYLLIYAVPVPAAMRVELWWYFRRNLATSDSKPIVPRFAPP